jgi:hypothetical protein
VTYYLDILKFGIIVSNNKYIKKCRRNQFGGWQNMRKGAAQNERRQTFASTRNNISKRKPHQYKRRALSRLTLAAFAYGEYRHKCRRNQN